MEGVFSRQLAKKKVMTSDGTLIGILHNIISDLRTGELMDLVVRPDMGIDPSEYNTEDGFILIPFSAVRSVRDYIVIDRKEAVRSSAEE
jgi:sporulation protein YlmC with PRC-barrel domain